MVHEKGRNKSKREQKKTERLMRLVGIDFCACGAEYHLRCCGRCRETHMNSTTNRVECNEAYQVDRSDIKSDKPRRPKRTWKYGRQQEGNENRRIKQQRGEKRQRDSLD